MGGAAKSWRLICVLFERVCGSVEATVVKFVSRNCITLLDMINTYPLGIVQYDW